MTFWGLHSRLGLAVAAVALAVDQIHKAWMIGVLQAAERGKITLTPFFDLVLVWNQGISYGLLKQDSALGRWALAAFSIVAVLVLIYWLAHLQTRLAALSVGLIAGGALGNAIDRIRYGAVADFFSFHLSGFQWYIFNLADTAIVMGVAGLLYDSLKSSHKRVENQL
jgi:signal peptidase II